MVTNAPDFTLRQLAYFAAAARHGTISGAAAELHVSPSALSDAITELERALGTSLCIRRRAHGLTVTTAGADVLSRAQELLVSADDLATSLRGEAGELVGPITIGCYPTLAPVVLPPLLADFGAAHPRVQLELVEATQDVLASGMARGEIDLAFVYDSFLPGHEKRARLFADRAHVLLAANDPLAAREVLRLEDLVDRDLILLDAPPSTTHTLSLFAARGLSPRIRHRTASFEAVRTLVARGLGYGILVQRTANDRSYEGYQLVTREISPAVPAVGIDAVWPDAGPPPARVRALIEFAHSVTWPEEGRV